MGESTPSFKIRKKSSLLGCVLELLISTAGGRFPRAWLEPPCASHSGVSRLMGLHYRSSHRRPFAIPAGVAAFRSNQLGKRSILLIFQPAQQMEYTRLLGEMRPR